MTPDLVPVAMDLAQYTDDDLTATQIALGIACGRRRTALRTKHRTKFCLLFRTLDLEQQRRNRLSPTPPFVA